MEDTMLKVVDSSKPIINNDVKIRCCQSIFQGAKYCTRTELFSGFNTIKIITFSYDVKFLDEILKQFDYGEIILGGDFMVKKDLFGEGMLYKAMSQLFNNGYTAQRSIASCETLLEMLRDGNVSIKASNFFLDHRKLYLLKADDGRTRVIKTSANMTRTAWNGNQIEYFDYDDTSECYDYYENEFETAWDSSSTIPYELTSAKKSKDYIEGNPILKDIKETKEALIFTQPEVSMDISDYVCQDELSQVEYNDIVKGLGLRKSAKVVEIKADKVTKMEKNHAELKMRKLKIKKEDKPFPKLRFDMCSNEAYIDDNLLDLHPSADSVRQDIDSLLSIFDNFSKFIGDTDSVKETHFKILNILFASPFIAKYRWACTHRSMGVGSLPLFMLISSSGANCGKTFMINVIRKLMIGETLKPSKKAEVSKAHIQAIQDEIVGVPVFIDEVDSSFISRLSDVIKGETINTDVCPMIVFASNNSVDPDETLRKRMLFFRLSTGLPSDIDQCAYQSEGCVLISKLTNSLYREYLRRMFEKVGPELDKLNDLDCKFADDYYPDIVKTSSEVIVDIFKDFGYDLPDYIRAYEWEQDYSVNAKSVYDSVFKSILKMYEQNPKVFTVTQTHVIIEVDKNAKLERKFKSWENTLPIELEAECQPARDGLKFSFNRAEFEKRVNFKFRKKLFGKW